MATKPLSVEQQQFMLQKKGVKINNFVDDEAQGAPKKQEVSESDSDNESESEIEELGAKLKAENPEMTNEQIQHLIKSVMMAVVYKDEIKEQKLMDKANFKMAQLKHEREIEEEEKAQKIKEEQIRKSIQDDLDEEEKEKSEAEKKRHFNRRMNDEMEKEGKELIDKKKEQQKHIPLKKDKDGKDIPHPEIETKTRAFGNEVLAEMLKKTKNSHHDHEATVQKITTFSKFTDDTIDPEIKHQMGYTKTKGDPTKYKQDTTEKKALDKVDTTKRYNKFLEAKENIINRKLYGYRGLVNNYQNSGSKLKSFFEARKLTRRSV